MALQFVVGNSGSGKSTYLYDKVVKESLDCPAQQFIVLVPEQFTLSTQKELVTRHPAHSIMNIEVLSFNRLAYRVFDELGIETLHVLEEMGKNLLLQNVGNQKREQLQVLGNNITKPGYVTQMKSLISELMQYNISPDDFEQMLQNPGLSKTFVTKATDILTMYRGFIEEINGRYITAEEILQLLAVRMRDSKLVKDSIVVIDGFTGFTPVQNLVMEELVSLAKEVAIAVTCDVRESLLIEAKEQQLFYMSRKFVQGMEKLCERKKVEMKEPVFLSPMEHSRLEKDSMLFHLEQQLFRTNKEEKKVVHSEENHQIQLYSLPNPQKELEFVAADITRRIRQEGMRYQDFAIVCPSLENYQYLVDRLFEAYQIPYFIDANATVMYHPLLELIRSSFMLHSSRFSYDSMMRYLRCGLHDFSLEEIDYFQNYLRKTKIRGAKNYRKNFTICPKGYTMNDLLLLNEMRQKIMEPLLPFLETMKGKEIQVKETTVAVYQLLQALSVEEKLQQMKRQYEQEQDATKVQLYAKLYEKVIELFEKIVELLGQESMTQKEYVQILDAGFDLFAVGMLPQGNDHVVIGDIERTRLEHIKVLYLVGANDGAIPKGLGNGGIFSQVDRERLLQMGYEMAPGDRQKAFFQRFYLYMTMTKPSQGLVMTYARADLMGASLQPSYLVQKVVSLYEGLEVIQLEQLPEELNKVTVATLRKWYLEQLRELAQGNSVEGIGAAYQVLQEAGVPQLHQLEEMAFFHHKKDKLNQAAVEAVYGNHLKGSVTRLEEYAKCAYRYFLHYGLKIQEEIEYELNALDKGNLYHHALEIYGKSLQEQNKSWKQVSKEEMYALIREATKQALLEMEKAQILEGAKERYLVNRMSKTLLQTVKAITYQVKKGAFEPYQFEVDFKEIESAKALEIELDHLGKMQLRGKIDRLDLWEKEDKVYVKILDYKSSNQDIDLLHMYHGLQVQLVLYMDAALQGMKKKFPQKTVEPAGMFYYHVHTPLIDGTYDMTSQEIEQGFLKALKVAGFVNEDKDVVGALDEEISEAVENNQKYRSDVIPVNTNKNGTFDANSNVISTDEFQQMGNHVRGKLKELGIKMFQGDISCNPIELGDNKGCKYCPYSSICLFDPTLDGYDYQVLEKLSKEEVMQRIKEKEEIEWGQNGPKNNNK